MVVQREVSCSSDGKEIKDRECFRVVVADHMYMEMMVMDGEENDGKTEERGWGTMAGWRVIDRGEKWKLRWEKESDGL